MSQGPFGQPERHQGGRKGPFGQLEGTREAGKDSCEAQGSRKGSIGQPARHREAGKNHLDRLRGTREAPGRLNNEIGQKMEAVKFQFSRLVLKS